LRKALHHKANATAHPKTDTNTDAKAHTTTLA
jgi:hypothetical protein